jgi:carbon monoxide dehydrogenase subunit G
MNAHFTSEIACPPAVLWSYLENSAKQKQWMKGLESVEPEGEGPVGVGSVAKLRIKEGGRIAEYRSRVVEREPYTHLAVAVTGKNFGNAEMRIDYRLTDLGGRTRLEYDCAFVGGGFVMKVMMALFGWFLKKQLTSFMGTLKRLAEAETAPADQPVG